MKLSELKEQIRGIIRERSVKAIQKDYSNVVSDMEKHLELYKKSKGTPEEKKHIGHLRDLTAKKKKLQAELDIAVSNLYKNAELKVEESVNEGKYYVTYNRGRGQGKGLEMQSDPKTFKPTGKPKVFSSYNDAKKYAEKMEKIFRNSIGGSTAYWVSDEKMNPIKEQVNEVELKKGDVIKFKDGKSLYILGAKGDGYDYKDGREKGHHPRGWFDMMIKSKKAVVESLTESTEPEVISQLRDIVKTKQYQSVKDPSSGKKMKVDMQTANMVLKIYDGLSNVNKQNMVKMGLPKMIDVSYRITTKYR